MQNFIIFNLFS